MSRPSNEALHEDVMAVAKEVAESEYLGRDGIHAIYRGMEEKGGQQTGREAIVFVVGEGMKKAMRELRQQGIIVVPRHIEVNGVRVPTDVQEGPQPSPELLWLDHPRALAEPRNVHQQCYNCPIPGGVQMQPAGANWVGTLGGALSFRMQEGTIFGCLTNWHVAVGGRYGVGHNMIQPSGSAPWFGKLATWQPIKFGSGSNLIDCALINCARTDGLYAPLTHTVRPENVGVGRISNNPYTNPRLGDRVWKSGRTTQVTRGSVVGIDATSMVDFGSDGTARFDKQIVVRADSGHFSQGGDSGSLVLLESGNRPYGLLFAGGGLNTIINPIQFILDWSNAQFL